ncbi:MAG: MYXO-CTERM sorting domain-containing protein, partial [Nannocystaceae bacterium]|nr:MYXO-CTERM sorting domain-containing protein [Nannocystaceae bacterium]
AQGSDGGCSCRTGPRANGAWLSLLALLGLTRRRRTASCAGRAL